MGLLLSSGGKSIRVHPALGLIITRSTWDQAQCQAEGYLGVAWQSVYVCICTHTCVGLCVNFSYFHAHLWAKRPVPPNAAHAVGDPQSAGSSLGVMPLPPHPHLGVGGWKQLCGDGHSSLGTLQKSSTTQEQACRKGFEQRGEP